MKAVVKQGDRIGNYRGRGPEVGGLKRMKVQLTRAEHQQVTEQAGQAGISMSRWIVANALYRSDLATIELIEDLTGELRALSQKVDKSATTFNRIAHHANTTQQVSEADRQQLTEALIAFTGLKFEFAKLRQRLAGIK